MCVSATIKIWLGRSRYLLLELQPQEISAPSLAGAIEKYCSMRIRTESCLWLRPAVLPRLLLLCPTPLRALKSNADGGRRETPLRLQAAWAHASVLHEIFYDESRTCHPCLDPRGLTRIAHSKQAVALLRPVPHYCSPRCDAVRYQPRSCASIAHPVKTFLLFLPLLSVLPTVWRGRCVRTRGCGSGGLPESSSAESPRSFSQAHGCRIPSLNRCDMTELRRISKIV
ncbi:hypothetical protein K461DRAFT_128709 [Myriangium duriaei CBS 260.36]|uniref:Uncharacterized protein n=1 Tax=Myriangium duriaei CBS 260.36 TaxID=1168546 RepID=A0A9P4J728_9PEZI|nr:hypothetical protein K461DRAFT_128709 [Myriangium duriaei CBS 260.36]